MKRFTEPAIGAITIILSFEIWTNIIVSLALAFLGGALGFLGKYVCQRIITGFQNRKNKPIE